MKMLRSSIFLPLLGTLTALPTVCFAETGSVTCLFKGFTEAMVVEFDSKQNTVAVDGKPVKVFSINKRYITYSLVLGGADFETKIDRYTGNITMDGPADSKLNGILGRQVAAGTCEKTRQKF